MTFIVKCSGCGQKNRVAIRPLPVCGRCKASLAQDLVDVVMEAAAERRRARIEDMGDALQAAAERILHRREGTN